MVKVVDPAVKYAVEIERFFHRHLLSCKLKYLSIDEIIEESEIESLDDDIPRAIKHRHTSENMEK